MDNFMASAHNSANKHNKDLSDVELRRLLEEHLERKRLKAEFGDIIDM